ncbi:hypothetical protein H0H93_011479 [Arthromyces matolae]|nr:hypothetical protein H0H93_011479 [Arthromyces matolae]
MFHSSETTLTGNFPPADYFLVAEVLDRLLEDHIPHEFDGDLKHAIVQPNSTGLLSGLEGIVPETDIRKMQDILNRGLPFINHGFKVERTGSTLILTRHGKDPVHIPMNIHPVNQAVASMWRAGPPIYGLASYPTHYLFPVSPDPLNAEEYVLAALGVMRILNSKGILHAFGREFKDAVDNQNFNQNFTGSKLILFLPHYNVNRTRTSLETGVSPYEEPESFNVLLVEGAIRLTWYDPKDVSEAISIRHILIDFEEVEDIAQLYRPELMEGPCMGMHGIRFRFPIFSQ